jgi:hypothetical protein
MCSKHNTFPFWSFVQLELQVRFTLAKSVEQFKEEVCREQQKEREVWSRSTVGLLYQPSEHLMTE